MSAAGRTRRGKLDPATSLLFAEPPAKKRKANVVPEAAAPEKDTGEEFYPTPASAILPILETDLLALPGGRWIEPCAGTGRIITTVNEFRGDVHWRAFEIDPRLGPVLSTTIRQGVDLLEPCGDFVHGPFDWTGPRAAVCLFNPPFSLALQFVIAAFERADHVLMLQRLNWLASARASWLRAHQPDVLALAERPSFTPDGKTDSAEYGWFYWPPGDRRRRVGRVAMLAPTRGGQLDLLNP